MHSRAVGRPVGYYLLTVCKTIGVKALVFIRDGAQQGVPRGNRKKGVFVKNTRRAVLTVVLGLVMAATLALVGCGSQGSSGSSSSATPSPTASASSDTGTLKTGRFVVGFDQDFPPYGYVGDDGQYTGLDLDLAAEVARRNGWEVVYKPINWDAKDLEISSGSIDCIWNGFTIEGREDGYTFTDPYMDNSQVIVVKKDSGINSLSDLSGKNVLVQADSAAYSLFTDDDGSQKQLASTFKSLQTTPEYNTAFQELEMGTVDAVGIDLPVAKFEIQGKEDTYTILDEHLDEEHFGVGFQLGNTELRDKVQQTLIDMTNDGTAKSICDKYADQGVNYDQWLLGK